MVLGFTFKGFRVYKLSGLTVFRVARVWQISGLVALNSFVLFFFGFLDFGAWGLEAKAVPKQHGTQTKGFQLPI